MARKTGFGNKNGTNPTLVDSLAQAANSQARQLISVKEQAKHITGGRVTVKVGGRPILFAFGVSINISQEYEEIRTIDEYIPFELVPTHIKVSGVLNCLKIPGDSPTRMKFYPNSLSFLFHQYCTIEIRDKQSDNIIFFTEKAMFTNRTDVHRVDSLSEMTLEFKAIGWRDEVPPAPPVGYNDAAKGNLANSIGNAISDFVAEF